MKTVAQPINSTGRLRTTKNRTPKHPRGGKSWQQGETLQEERVQRHMEMQIAGAMER